MSGQRCSNTIDVISLANDRGNVVPQDFVDCQAHCDATDGVASCSLLGSTAAPFVRCSPCSTAVFTPDNQGTYTTMFSAECVPE